jgi:predicted secreted protein/N-acetylneuraminic acid mutarotase
MKKAILGMWILALGIAPLSLAVDDLWTTKADMPTARTYLSTSVVNGKIYAIGGSPRIEVGISTIEEYNPTTDTWTAKSPMPTPRWGLSTSVVNGKIYAIGGARGFPIPGIRTVEEYDPATDTWTTKSSMPTARWSLSTSVVNGKIYAIGGEAPTGSRTMDEYDPATDTWTRKASMAIGRYAFSTSVVNGKIYAIGGVTSYPSYTSSVEEYDPATDTWTRKADMPTARTFYSTCMVNGKIYTLGGAPHPDEDPVPVIYEYDPTMDTWTTKADMLTARTGLATSAVNGKIYAIGGSTTGVSSGVMSISTVEEYDPYPLVVDFNGDGIVDSADVCIMIDYWGTDEPLCDIGPMPWGDGIVDVEDLKVLAEHLFEVYPSANTVDVTEADNGGQIELEQDKLLVVTLESNPSTGYQWELVENNDFVLKQFGQKEYKPPETSNPRMVGAGGWEIFRFKAVSTGQTTLEFVYHRAWEDTEPLKTFSIQVVVN